MDFSDQFRSIFPLASIFYPPNLPYSSSIPPFTPLTSPLHLLSSPSLLPHFPPSTPPSLHFYSLHSFLRSEIPYPSPRPPSLHPSRPSPPSNLLVSLSTHLPHTSHLFFPTGENSHGIAFLSITSVPNSPYPFQLTLDHSGDVFKQTEGFKHPFNRIFSLHVSPCSGLESASGSSLTGNRVSEGFLLATTLYTVNWFRVETELFQSGCEKKQRPFLMPLANHGFESPVVHACFSPHFKEESAVLLESGELFLFNICSKQCGKIRVRVKKGQNLGRFLSCEYGAAPWLIIVACAKAIVLVDLRNPGEEQTRILFKPNRLSSYNVNLLEDKKEKFLVFCKSAYSDYHFSVLTNSRLMLLDVRRPLHPILTWDHGLDDPNYVTMVKLEELKPSNGHEPVLGSVFTILAGSLNIGEFKLFHYGSLHKQEASSDSSYSAWGVPSGIFLSSQCCGTSDQLMDKFFAGKSASVKDISWLRKQEKIVGFFVIPFDHSSIELVSGGFTVIRLMSFGRLEVQNYGPSDDISDNISDNKMCNKEESMSESCDILTACPDCKREELPTRRCMLDFRYLKAYVDGDLSETLPKDSRQSCEVSQCEDMLAIRNLINNAAAPSSIGEIAFQSALNGLKPEHIPLTFAKYSDIFANKKDSNFQLFHISKCSVSGKKRPLLVTKPYRRGQRWSKKMKAPKDSLIGPVLPVPVLLTLEEREKKSRCFWFEGNGTVVDQKCTEVIDSVFPANITADPEETNENEPFFVYEPQCDIVRSRNLEKRDQRDFRDEKYETCVCRINTGLTCGEVKPEPDSVGPELLDFGPVKLGFDIPKVEVGKVEIQELEKLKGRFSNWFKEYKPYKDFCSSKIPLNQ